VVVLIVATVVAVLLEPLDFTKKSMKIPNTKLNTNAGYLKRLS
jgi:hypothetical protein